jgi:PP-loop superfamily ATP-utilizing enzyme
MEKFYSSWAENSFTKEEIRTIARRIGLSVGDKPPLACLASRIPFGEKLTLEKLNRIGKAENIIRKITQAKQLRVRDHNGLARIEVGRDERQIFFKTKIMDIIAKELIELGVSNVRSMLPDLYPSRSNVTY